MKSNLLYSLFISLLFITFSDAQTSQDSWAVGLHFGNSQYSGDLGSSLFKFEPFQEFRALSLGKRLNRSFDIELRAEKGRHGHWEDDIRANSFLSDQLAFNLGLHYKFLGDRKFKPYLSAALAFSDYGAIEGRGKNSTDFVIPVGIGFDYEFYEHFSLNFQTIFGLNFGDSYDGRVANDDNDNYFHHSLGIKYNFAFGSDMDGDGVADKDDKCPNVAGLKSLMGCPDSDNDGIIDSEDSCPTIMGTAANNGCPEISIIHVDVMQEALYGVYFDTEKATLKAESYAILNRIVTILNENEYYNLRVEGHTDSAGDAAFNQKLSKDRSSSVKKYLVSKGINAQRIKTAGFGESKPVSTNETEAGKKLNRRVEFTLFY